MKIRHGFVSNSSSSSFVIAKSHMNEEQITHFSNFIGFLEKLKGDEDDGIVEFVLEDIKYNISFCDGNIPEETNYYFMGTIDQSMIEPIHMFLKNIGIDSKYYEFGI
jgi:hypothetical protein